MKLDYTQLNNQNSETMILAKKKFVISEIQKRISKINKKTEEIENLTYEKDLILDNIVDIIKEDLENSDNNFLKGYKTKTLCDEAFWYNQLRKKKVKVSDLTETEKEEKQSFDFILSTIKSTFLKKDKNFKFVDMEKYNFGQCYWFIFSYNKVKLRITIPVFANATIDTYSEFLEGYSVLYEASINNEESKYWLTISMGFDFDKIANDIEIWASQVKDGIIK